MLTSRHPVDFAYPQAELEALFRYARAHDVEQGGLQPRGSDGGARPPGAAGLSSTFALLSGRGVPEEPGMSHGRPRQLGRGRQGVEDSGL
jgi:hypothetical protein